MIFSLRWLGNMMQSHWINRTKKFEQITYRKQVDFKKPTTNYNGSLKSLYSKAVDQLGLTYRLATIIFSGNYIRSAHA